jgi:hypothetical protein
VVLPPERDVEGVRVAFERAYPLAVTVRDEDGSAVAGASVVVTLFSDDPMRRSVTGTTGPDGRAEFDVDDAVSSIWAAPAGGTTQAAPLLRGEAVNPGDASEVTVVLRHAGFVTGQIFDPDGRPIAGADLDVEQNGGVVAGGQASDAGTFRLAVPASGRCTLSFSGRWRNKTKEDLPFAGRWPDLTAGMQNLELRAQRVPQDRSLAVRVLGPDGAGIPNMPVELIGNAYKPFAVVETDATGVAKFEKLLRTALRVRIAKEAAETASGSPPVEIVVGADDTEAVLRFIAWHEVTGIVVDGAGQPLPDVLVQLRRGRRRLAQCDSDARGRFRLRVPAQPAGAIQASATQSRPEGDASSAIVEVTPPAEDMRLVVR